MTNKRDIHESYYVQSHLFYILPVQNKSLSIPWNFPSIYHHSDYIIAHFFRCISVGCSSTNSLASAFPLQIVRYVDIDEAAGLFIVGALIFLLFRWQTMLSI